MSTLALCLVLLAALSHASWNISAKFAAEAKHFVWLFSAGSVLIYGPIVLAVLIVERLPRPASVLGPAGYILVLFAMRLAPVSHVAPARELSTLVGAWIGSRMLREEAGPWRIVGAALIAGGVIALALRA